MSNQNQFSGRGSSGQITADRGLVWESALQIYSHCVNTRLATLYGDTQFSEYTLKQLAIQAYQAAQVFTQTVIPVIGQGQQSFADMSNVLRTGT